jgi:hypothetical protein
LPRICIFSNHLVNKDQTVHVRLTAFKSITLILISNKDTFRETTNVTYIKRTIVYTIEYKLHLGLLFTCEHLNLKWQIYLIFILQTKKTSAEIHKREEIIIHPRSKKYRSNLYARNHEPPASHHCHRFFHSYTKMLVLAIMFSTT